MKTGSNSKYFWRALRCPRDGRDDVENQSGGTGFFHFDWLLSRNLLSTLTSSEQKSKIQADNQSWAHHEKFTLGEFDDLIFPTPSKQFHEKYFGKQVLHLHDQVVGESGRSGNVKRASLFNVTDILSIINKGYVKPMENMKFVHRDIEAFVKDEFDEKDPSSSVVTERTFNDHYAAGHTMLLKHAEKHSKKTHEVACVTHEVLDI